MLKDAGLRSPRSSGQLVIAAASIADFGAIILLSLFFSGEARHRLELLLLGGFALVASRSWSRSAARSDSRRISDDLLRLQDTTAQIRVRGAFVLFVGFVALAEALGPRGDPRRVPRGRGAVARRPRPDDDPPAASGGSSRPQGFGMFIPVFFVTSGVRFDLDALFASASTLALVPVFLAALLLVRGVPALLYLRTIGPRGTVSQRSCRRRRFRSSSPHR